MIVSDKIYFNLDAESVPENIFDVLTYNNPEYFAKANMGISVYGIPKVITTGAIRGRTLEVMRGEAQRIKPYFTPEQWKPSFEHPDHPIKLQYINNDFELDNLQEGAVAAMAATRQGVVHAVTSAGKSLIILKAITVIGQRALIVVHRKILMEQFLEDIKKYIRDENGNPITAGIVGGGVARIGPITIAIDKSLAKNLDQYREQFGVAVLDECHLAPAATMFGLLNSLNTRHRYGVTGTLRRKDEKQFLIHSTFGQVIYTIGKDELLEKGRVVPVVPKVIESETRFDWNGTVEALTEQGDRNPTTKARALQEKTIAGDRARNDMILRLVAGLPGKTMVISRYVAPCYTLQDELGRKYGRESGVITGKDPKEALESYKDMKDGDSRTVFATLGCVSTGVSISDLDNIVLISPIYNNELLLHQVRGRLMRTAEGKTHGTLYFIYDPYIFGEEKLRRFLRIMES